MSLEQALTTAGHTAKQTYTSIISSVNVRQYATEARIQSWFYAGAKGGQRLLQIVASRHPPNCSGSLKLAVLLTHRGQLIPRIKQ